MRFRVIYTDNHGVSYEWITGHRRIHSELQRPPSQLWFCEVCGVVYAKVKVSEFFDMIPSELLGAVPYIAITCRCESHQRRNNYSIYTGGSILAENLNNIMEMPAELVEKEFWIHLRETERLIKLGELGNE